jgi:hypothetical protein
VTDNAPERWHYMALDPTAGRYANTGGEPDTISLPNLKNSYLRYTDLQLNRRQVECLFRAVLFGSKSVDGHCVKRAYSKTSGPIKFAGKAV